MTESASVPLFDSMMKRFSKLEGLGRLALDQRGSSSALAGELWSLVDPALWSRMRNPWLILQSLSDERFTQLSSDKNFMSILNKHLEMQKERLQGSGWFKEKYADASLKHIAYFSMEFGLSEALPIYSGGLGMLAGDHLKAASDLDIPLVAIGLLYQRGYFRQYINGKGQQEIYPYNDPGQLPIMRTRNSQGDPLSITLELCSQPISLRVWEVRVGKIKLYLLDSNDAVNTPLDRGITNELYGGSSEHRLRQEIVLGIGGWRLLEALSIKPEVCHLNEGHAAFAVLARIESTMRDYGISFEEALTITRSGNLFTTHTPVAAGFDRFLPELIEKYFGCYAETFNIKMQKLLALGRQNANDPQELFNMAYLAFRGSGAVNGVSRLHGEVSRKIFASLFPRWPIEQIPVGHITNGVHVPSWESPEADQLWTKACGETRWHGTLETIEKDVQKISDKDLWSFRNQARLKLIDYVRKHLCYQRQLEGKCQPEKNIEQIFDPNVLTLGFARRFAEYKRVNLLLADQERLLRLISNSKYPVQIVIAGKAHPQDGKGKAIIQEWVQFIQNPAVSSRIVFLTDYDILMAERLVQGVDVWINTPRRPWEASGTSGMKLLANGGLNFSELDGWWAEAYSPEVGWALGDGKEHGQDLSWDRTEAEMMYSILEQQVIPAFYNRNAEGMSVEWLKLIRKSMATLTARFSTNRMVREYTEKYYLPAATAYCQRADKKGELGIILEKRRKELQAQWNSAKFLNLQIKDNGQQYVFEVKMDLGKLDKDAVRVELYANARMGEQPFIQEMARQAKGLNGECTYLLQVPKGRPVIDYTPRLVSAKKDGLQLPAEANEILWQH